RVSNAVGSMDSDLRDPDLPLSDRRDSGFREDGRWSRLLDHADRWPALGDLGPVRCLARPGARHLLSLRLPAQPAARRGSLAAEATDFQPASDLLSAERLRQGSCTSCAMFAPAEVSACCEGPWWVWW